MVLLLLLAVPAWSAELEQWDIPEAGKIVAFGDVHGAFDELVALLEHADIIDQSGRWIASDTRLVSLGDLFDRGPGSRKVVELLMRLQREAPALKSSVHVVLGNHEKMLLSGDMRYVSAAEYASYAGDESPASRDELYRQYSSIRPGQQEQLLRATFDKTFPAGFIALSAAISPQGEIGQWLLRQPLVLRIGDTVFTHGGISSDLLGLDLDEINKRQNSALNEYVSLVAELTVDGVLNPTIGFLQRKPLLTHQLQQFHRRTINMPRLRWLKSAKRLLELQDSLLFSPRGLLWYRGTAQCHADSEAYDVERILQQWNATRIVIGHTPTPSRRVTSRMGGTVIMADTGMLSDVYKGRASAVVIDDGALSILYVGEDQAQSPVLVQGHVPRQPIGVNDQQLEQFLLTAQVIATEPVGTGITKPRRLSLKLGEVEMNAIYKTYDSHPRLQEKGVLSRRKYRNTDRYIYDVAAYKLDRILGLNMVPVSIEREINGEKGVLTVWLENTINERDRRKHEGEFVGHCLQSAQYRMRILFDVLIYNEDRNLTNILWTNDDYQLLLIDHSRAFRPNKKRPKAYKKPKFELATRLEKALRELNVGVLTDELRDYLNPSQIAAILARRNLILQEATVTGFMQ